MIVEILKPENQRKQIRELVDIFEEGMKDDEIKRRGLGEDEVGKRKQEVFDGLRGTGIRFLFQELISEGVVSDGAFVEPAEVLIDGRKKGKKDHEKSYCAVVGLCLNTRYTYDNKIHKRIIAVYGSNGLAIRGKEEFRVEADCSLSEAIIKALNNPMEQVISESEEDRNRGYCF